MNNQTEVNNTQAIAANELKAENERLRETVAAHESALEQLETSRDKYKDKYLAEEGRVSDLKVSGQQLHDLLLATELQLEEVEGVYNLIKTEVIKSAVKDDYMDNNLRQLRSLIEIAQSHNSLNIDQ